MVTVLMILFIKTLTKTVKKKSINHSINMVHILPSHFVLVAKSDELPPGIPSPTDVD